MTDGVGRQGKNGESSICRAGYSQAVEENTKRMQSQRLLEQATERGCVSRRNQPQ